MLLSVILYFLTK